MKFKDINFFTPYKGRNKENKNNHIYIYTLLGILATFIIGTVTWNSVNIYKLNKEIVKYNEELNKPEVQEKAKEAKDINNKITILNEYDNKLTKVTEAVVERNAVSNLILDKISSTLPSDVSFKNITVNKDSIVIQAISKSRPSIGELQHNLKNLDIIDDVSIGAISGDDALEGEYSFDINCILRRVD